MSAQSHHLNCSDLAAKLGHHRNFISAMKAAGYQMEFAGTRSTLGHAEQWLRDHPEFRAKDYFDRSRNKKGIAATVQIHPVSK